MKYDLLREEGTNLLRLKALKSFGDVKEGDLGGLVETPENLSQEGNCWVYKDAQVSGNAQVSHNAQVSDNAKVFGNTEVSGNAKVYDNARVFGNAEVPDKAEVPDSNNTTKKEVTNQPITNSLSEKCWMVVRSSDEETLSKHPSFEEARDKAEALLKCNPTNRFYILEKVAEVKCSLIPIWTEWK